MRPACPSSSSGRTRTLDEVGLSRRLWSSQAPDTKSGCGPRPSRPLPSGLPSGVKGRRRAGKTPGRTVESRAGYPWASQTSVVCRGPRGLTDRPVLTRPQRRAEILSRDCDTSHSRVLRLGTTRTDETSLDAHRRL